MRCWLALLVLALGCSDGPEGPTGPGGASSRFEVTSESGEVRLSALEVRARRVGTSSVATLVLLGTLPRDGMEAPAEQLRLEMDLDLHRLDEGPFPIDLEVRMETTSSTNAVATTRGGGGALRGLRWLRRCDTCPDPGGARVVQAFAGSVRLPTVEAERIEALAELTTSGPFLSEPNRPRQFTLSAFWDVARP